jgi:hypothetical protein
MGEARMRRLGGECLCGRVRYEVDDAFHAAFFCHCSRCRKATGSAFKAMAAIRRSALTLLADEQDLLIYGDRNGTHDVHCGHCGSLLYSDIAENGNVHVAMGTLTESPGVRPSFHIFAGSRAEWYEITDGLPQFEGLPE